MARKTIFTGLTLLTLALYGDTANAASFDCAKASKPDEVAVCKSQQLSELDVKMAALFGVRMEIPVMMGARGAARDEQEDFLSKRATCGGNVACIENAYTKRIADLEQIIKAAMQDYCRKIGLCG